jgi:Swiss Army Knife protein, DSP-PTPase phosphatase domain
VVCQHTEDPVTFPDGTRVLASGWLERRSDAPAPDFGLYLDPSWAPWWPAVALEWPDFSVPADAEVADAEIRSAFARARRGERVEVACVGGHGRTGTVLACMAVLAGVPGPEAVEWVRAHYCRRAVQEPAQQYWVERWAERQF